MDVLADAYVMRDRLASLKPSDNKVEIEHFKLMLDILINYLEFKQCECQFESKDYEISQRPALAERMAKICKEGEKMDTFLRNLTYDTSK